MHLTSMSHRDLQFSGKTVSIIVIKFKISYQNVVSCTSVHAKHLNFLVTIIIVCV
uniref:Uncharacterized protein n=1 Tax=Arion vulgaris TaxID=1028688 RepID=A0A0B7BVH3_9EUPU